ncbi:MAG: response regulator, partial [Candidatus Hodarchaeota archaeon]
MENSVTVLIVDDEEAFLDLAKIYLQEKSNNVIIDSISSPLDLSLRLERQTYDVIVSDYEMPHLTGLELLKNLREDGNTIPFIILTGKGREDTVIEALNLGAD